MSKLIIAGNEIIPGTITVTANNSTITPKDDLRVILNISAVGAVTLSNGTDTTQRVEVFNVSSSACSITYKGSSGNVTYSLRNASGMTLLWTGTYWKATIAGLITGTDANGATINYTSEATIDLHEEPVQYSTTEQDTGKTWIDGKPIYRKVITKDVVVTSASQTSYVIADISSLNIDSLVNLHGTVQDASGFMTKVPYVYGTAQQANVYIASNNLTTAILGWIVNNTYKFKFVLEYTKST